MNRLCKTCTFFANENGKTLCKKNNVERDITDEAPPEFACWVRKPKPSPTELSHIRSLNGRKGGRPKGTGKGKEPTKQIQVKEIDHSVLSSYAQKKKTSISDTVHRVCKSLVCKYPDIKPENWKD